ncbi:MAG: TonB family protein [Microcoleus sp. SIO2G3]|nr:TonB family protein [Microcoleus sp. SIO2G3]
MPNPTLLAPPVSLPTIPTPPVSPPTTPTPPLPQQSTSQQPIPQLPQPSSTPTSPAPTTVATGGTTPTVPPTAPSTPTPAGTSTPPLPTNQRQEQLIARMVAERAQQQENLRFNPAGTTDEEARKTYVALLNQVNRTETEVSNITGTYPIEACPKQLAGTTVVWAMVGTNGSVTDPQVIKGTGYPVLDQRALEVVKSQRFGNRTGSPQPYRVNVSFEYNKEKCPASLAAPSNSTPRTTGTSTGTNRQNSTPRTTETSTGTNRQNSTPRTTGTSTGTNRQNSTPRTTETSTGTNRQNSTETSAQNFVENLHRNLTTTPRQNSDKPSRQNSTETPPQESDKTPRQGTEGGEN